LQKKKGWSRAKRDAAGQDVDAAGQKETQQGRVLKKRDAQSPNGDAASKNGMLNPQIPFLMTIKKI